MKMEEKMGKEQTQEKGNDGSPVEIERLVMQKTADILLGAKSDLINLHGLAIDPRFPGPILQTLVKHIVINLIDVKK